MENKQKLDRREGWLADLKVGDKVIVGYTQKMVGTVTKITKTGRLNVKITKNGCEYSFYHDGNAIGGADVYGFGKIFQWSEEEQTKIIQRDRRANLVYSVQMETTLFGNKMSLDALEKINAIIKMEIVRIREKEKNEKR